MVLEAAFPIGKKINALKAIQKIDATISNGSFTNLPGEIDIEDAELVAAFNKESSDISGTASFMGAPAEFSVQFDREKDSVKAVAVASPSIELAALLARQLDLRLDGRLGGKIEYTGNLAKTRARLELPPLAGVSIDVLF